MAKKKKAIDFNAIFTAKMRYLSIAIPARISGFRGTDSFRLRMPDILKYLTEIIVSGQTCRDWTFLPYLVFMAAAFGDIANLSLAVDKKTKIATALCLNIMRLHNLQHESWRDKTWDRLSIHKDDLDKNIAVFFCRREREEAVSLYKSKRERFIAENALAWHSAYVASGFLGGVPHDDDDVYIEEMPRRKCPTCNKSSWPTPEPFIEAGHGRRFFCPFCGHNYGYQGLKKIILDEDGKRKKSTAWHYDRLGIDYCQICGKSQGQLEQEGNFLTSHHVKPVSEGGEDVPSNILILCWDCHKWVHARREGK